MVNMRKTSGKLVILLVCAVIVMLALGCEEETLSQTTKEVKKTRLIAAENDQLKKELAQCKSAMERLGETMENNNEGMNIMIDTVIAQNQTLIEENKKLKKKLKELK